MNVYDRLEELGIKLLDPTPKGGIYSLVRPYGDHLLYVSAQRPTMRWTATWPESWAANIQ